MRRARARPGSAAGWGRTRGSTMRYPGRKGISVGTPIAAAGAEGGVEPRRNAPCEERMGGRAATGPLSRFASRALARGARANIFIGPADSRRPTMKGIEGSPAGARAPSARRFRRHTHLRPRWRLLPGSTTASGTSSSSPTTRTRTPGRSSSRRTRSAGSSASRTSARRRSARSASRLWRSARRDARSASRRSSPARRSPAPRGARDAQGVRR